MHVVHGSGPVLQPEPAGGPQAEARREVAEQQVAQLQQLLNAERSRAAVGLQHTLAACHTRRVVLILLQCVGAENAAFVNQS